MTLSYHIRCSDIQFCLEDLATYIHLLNVALNTKLCLGKMDNALELGTHTVHDTCIIVLGLHVWSGNIPIHKLQPSVCLFVF